MSGAVLTPGRRRRLRRWPIVALLCLGACVQHWQRPGGTVEEFERDHAHCERLAKIRGFLLHQERYERCMRTRGYRLR